MIGSGFSGTTPHHYSYAVIFRADDPAQYHATSPIVDASRVGALNVTRQHGLPRDIKAALPALWYCLHLPRTSSDYRFVPAGALIAGRTLDLPPLILLAPSSLVDSPEMAKKLSSADLIFVSDDALVEIESTALKSIHSSRTCTFKDLGEAMLRHHWVMLATRATRVDEGYTEPPRMLRNIREATTLLPTVFLTRNTRETHLIDARAASEPVYAALFFQRLVHFAAEEAQGATESKPGPSPNSAIQLVPDKFSVPVSFVAPGVSPTYQKSLGIRAAPLSTDPDLDWTTQGAESSDDSADELALRFLATHRALAQDGIAYRLPDIPRTLWQDLAALEANYLRKKPRQVLKALRTIGETAAGMLDDQATELAMRSSQITCFSGFPLGLAIPEGTTSPLSIIRPFTYRPIMPLLRAIHLQSGLTGTRYWKRELRLLVAECLRDDDRIRVASERGWRMLAENLGAFPGTSVSIVFPRSITELREQIMRGAPHALILSAHGTYRRRSNVAGLVVGDDVLMGPELEWVPEVVFLAACHVAPRGQGAVSVADLLMRQGAHAVLATQVPVDVSRNALLMWRLFTNIHAAMSGELQLRTLLDAWHHTASTNAVHDVIASSEACTDWATKERTGGLSALQEFKLNRSRGRLRATHIYDDTISVLDELAAEDGFASRFRSTLASHGYVPETLFYHLIGWPERIVLNDPVLDPTLGDSNTRGT